MERRRTQHVTMVVVVIICSSINAFHYGFGRIYGISNDSNNLILILDYCVSESWHGSNVDCRNTVN